MARRIVADAVHGAIKLNDGEWELIDTPSYQRLRQLKQLQMAHLTYPNATHTRFVHSLGVFAIMSRILEVAQDKLALEDRDVKDLRLAALLHDIGHYPYSHLMEKVDKVQLTEDIVSAAAGTPKEIDLTGGPAPYPKHEPLGRLIVTHREDVLRAIGGSERAERIADLFTRSEAADPQRSKLLHSSLDMDRFDFLLRDAKATGVPYGTVDLDYLLNNLRVSPSGMIGFSHKAIAAAEQFLFARFFMYKVVYFHKTTFGFEEACRHLLRRSRDAGLYNVPSSGEAIEEWVLGESFLNFTDAWVDDVVRQAADGKDDVLRALAETILYRRPPKLIREVRELKDLTASGSTGRCRSFLDRCEDRLEGLAEDLGVDPRLFLVTEPIAVTLESRGAKLTPESARDLQDEHEDELVKVFLPGDDEPTSLVDVPESITNVAANYAYQFARLYLVSQQPELVENARERVAEW